MPVHPTYPGVYVQEVPSSVHTIMGVATSITAFVGQASAGPVNTPQRVFSFSEYVAKYGAPEPGSYLGYSVQQFFLNGGSEAVIVRVGAGARAASLTLQSGAVKVLEVKARSQGQAGNGVEVTVSPEADTPGLFDLTVQNPGGRPETFSSLTLDPQSATYAVNVVGAESQLVRLVDLTGDIPGETDPRKDAQATLKSGAFTPEELTQAVITRADQDLRLSVDGLKFQTVTLAQPAEGSAHLDTIAADLQDKVRALGPAWATFESAAEGNRLVLKSGTKGKASRVEVKPGLKHDAARALKLFAMDGAVSTPVSASLMPAAVAGQHLQDGADGAIGETLAVYFPQTDGPVREGVYALEDVDLFNLLVLPGVSDRGVLAQAAQYCETRRAMLLIDLPRSAPTPQEAADLADSGALTVSKNAAAYYPWVQLPNPAGGPALTQPPSGTLAGVIARTDAVRGVWKAPAGTEASLVNVQGLDYVLTDAENGLLNPLGVNCLRTFRSFGPVAWGARTRRGDDDLTDQWKYLPVRRTALYIEESLYRGLKWVVFEPNDEPLWAQIRLNVGAFLHDLFRQGAFQGLTPRDAYFVKCDRETTTQKDIDGGIVNVLVGFAPLKPAEFVVLSLQQLAGQLQV